MRSNPQLLLCILKSNQHSNPFKKRPGTFSKFNTHPASQQLHLEVLKQKWMWTQNAHTTVRSFIRSTPQTTNNPNIHHQGGTEKLWHSHTRAHCSVAQRKEINEICNHTMNLKDVMSRARHLKPGSSNLFLRKSEQGFEHSRMTEKSPG